MNKPVNEIPTLYVAMDKYNHASTFFYIKNIFKGERKRDKWKDTFHSIPYQKRKDKEKIFKIASYLNPVQ